MNWMLVVGSLALLIWLVREYFLIRVETNTLMHMADWQGAVRVLSQGLNIIWPWESPVINGVVSLVVTHDSFTGDFETQDESTVSLKFLFNCRPSAAHSRRYIEFDPVKRREGIIGHLTAMASIRVRSCKDRDMVLNTLKEIAKDVESEFRAATSGSHSLLEEYFGVIVEQVAISDPGLPEILKTAQTEREAQEKKNETRKSEMESNKTMMSDLVKESIDLKSPISSKEAMDVVLLTQGKTKKDIKVIDLGPGAQTVATGAIGGLTSLAKSALEFAEKFTPKEGGKDGK